MHIIFSGNGTSGNHGCEAIVRGTTALLGTQNQYTVFSENPQDDTAYGIGDLADIRPAKQARKKDTRFIMAYLKMKMTGNYVDMDGLYYLPSIRAQKNKADIALAVGGDNYCYNGTGIYDYLRRAFQQQSMKAVLWGCSVEPEVVKQPEVARDLAGYDLIVARESITREAVSKVQKNVVLAPDPAFFMEPKDCEDALETDAEVIGINASPHILKCEGNQGMAYENYRMLIEHILNSTDASIALIPHVVWESNDDRKVLQRLYDDFRRNERLILVEDHTAPELKYIISKCSFFVGARTHATIAAYSTCVPTLVVGYSVKARGIARDLFGTEDGYVLPVQELSEPNQLTDAFFKLYAKREQIKVHLQNILPDYLAAAQEAVAAIENLE